MSDINWTNLREYSRVDAVIAIDVRLVPTSERQSIRSFISGDMALPEFQVPNSVTDPALAEWLTMLNAKLDAIATILASKGDTASHINQRKVNISGGGLSFDSQETYSIGDLLEIKMVLPVNLSSTIHIYGEVVAVRPTEDHCQTAVKFITVDDEIREQIVQFVFKAQRDILRQKRG
jgi:hypothetical protein